ncbi:MAG: Hsp20/alpha crystallin family protein [Amphibacillus sp.]|uniref:Putative small heat shock protein n=1 Tax=Amphibacillus xylanus (strain ATCC 51415 / DSM 6626 / JCM 7361 / LMG 17667 / NBRC 15112 / Ep01) TaxID=698758 RepID=K0J5I3_AMPXN|nr:Hsp20/alpha crystallin family protein [Amphibacillus xylanus]NMA90191.1 Hsp20/alpha crystallin family protein [Amphibacillus sp.]BAM48221.1 putative small heat shock protein [Amphibacillus xylanus NBRC 15112]
MAEYEQDFLKAAREWVRKMDSLFQRYSDDSLLASIDQFFQNKQIPTYIKNTEDEWIVTYQLPGVTKDRIKMFIRDNRLIVQVTEDESQEIKDDQKDLYHFKQFTRSRESIILLPGAIIPSTLKADFRNGLLKVKARKQRINKRDLLLD